MNFVIDIVLILILLGTTLNYFRMGFVKALFSICKFAVSVILAFALSSTVGSIISEKFVYDSVYESVHTKVEGIAGDVNEDLDMSGLVDKLPKSVQSLLASSGQDIDELKNDLGEDKITKENIEEFSASVSSRVSSVISNVIAFVIIFIVAMLLLGIVAFILDKICKLPGLRQINKTLGIIFGAICGILQVVIACTVITAILNMIGVNSPELSVEAMNEKTVVYSFVNNSGFSQWIMDILKSI